MALKKVINVLIIEDSRIVQNMLKDILGADKRIKVIGVAKDPYVAAAKIAEELPDVITLDIEMPRMNGMTFLKKLMKQHPIPVVVISSLTGDRSDLAIRALELGASEVVNKPRLTNKKEIDEYAIRVRDAVLAAAMHKVFKQRLSSLANISLEKPRVARENSINFEEKIILIGASTGGTELLSNMLKFLRTNLPPIVVVQHMPGEFTTAFARRLNQECELTVKEAEDGDQLKTGHVYIANGYHHLVVNKKVNHYVCSHRDGDMVNRHRPSVDVLFKSMVGPQAKHVMGILLTGMGRDGAKGLLELKKQGAICIAQDEKSSVVFGMPKEAIQINAVDYIGNPAQIINWINNFPE